MTPKQIHNLALTLYTVIVDSDAVAEFAVEQRCLHSCHAWGLEPPMATLISEALTGYLYNENRQVSPLVTCKDKAKAVLHHTMGGTLHVGRLASPLSTRVAPYGIAAMIEWALQAEEIVQ